MRKIIALIILPLMSGCINRIATTYQKPDSIIVSNNSNLIIVTEKDLFGLNIIHLGSIMIDEPYTYLTRSSCSKEVAHDRLRSDARSLNANLINITTEINPGEEKPPYRRSACYRCEADYYSIEFDTLSQKILARKSREIINYSLDKKLKWDDFKVELPESSEAPYEFVSTIQLISGKMSPWTGAYKDFEAYGAFYSDVSKVKRSYANEEKEKIMGLLFDLTQINAHILQQYLNSTKPRIADRKKIQKIVDNHLEKLKSEIDNFNSETDFGNNVVALEDWENRIHTETINLGIKQ